MTKVIQVVSAILIFLLLSLLVAVPVVGIDGLSAWMGCDIENILIEGTNNEYRFSLVDRAPILFILSLLLLGYLAYIFFRADLFLEQCKALGKFVVSFTKDTVKLIGQSNVKYFLLLISGVTLYLAYCYPLTLDEPMTYNDFIVGPFWHPLALYPYPNNHVFSSILINITNEIPGLDLLFRLRIPAVLISILTWIFAYRFVRKFYSENVALFVVAVGVIVVTNMQHAYIARGYAFVMFFVVVGLYAVFNIIEQKGNRRRDWIALVISSVLGAWTMPSYLYPFLTLNILIFVANYRLLKKQILYSLLVGILVFVVYSPILVVSGIEMLTSNEFVETIDRLTVVKSLHGFMLGVIVHIFYMPYYVIAGVFVLVFLYVLWRKNIKVLILWAVFCLTPCLFLALHSVIPFFRTFFYYGFIFIFLFGISFADVLNRVSLKKLTVYLLCIHIIGVVFFFKISRGLMPEVFQSDDTVQEVLADNKKYYISNSISWMQMINLQFEAERRGYNIEIVAGGETNIELLPGYDYYIIDGRLNTTSENIQSKEIVGIFSRPLAIYKK